MRRRLAGASRRRVRRAVRRPGSTTSQPADCQPGAGPQPVFADDGVCVSAARRVKPTGHAERRQTGRKRPLVPGDASQGPAHPDLLCGRPACVDYPEDDRQEQGHDPRPV